jgi:16S rRNA (uracil1498-N3)-methyltransferase
VALRRFYLDKSAFLDGSVRIGGELFHHIRDVCRFGAGDRFEILPGDGRACLAEIRDLGGKHLIAEILSKRVIPPPAKPLITLALSVPKLPKVDWIVEKSVELGVHCVRPFVSDFSFLRKASEISEARVQRWSKLVQSATQQSGRGELMGIEAAETLPALLERFNRLPATGGLFPYEGEAQVTLSDAIAALKTKPLDHLWIFVGSEGGFSRAEVQLFESRGLKPVTLGEQILRVETACLALTSIIKYEFGKL